MSDTEGTAAARPEDHVREFIKQLEHPETQLHTDTRYNDSDVYGGTSWGDAGKAAILSALKRGHELTEALVRADASLKNAADTAKGQAALLEAASLAAYRVWDRK